MGVALSLHGCDFYFPKDHRAISPKATQRVNRGSWIQTGLFGTRIWAPTTTCPRGWSTARPDDSLPALPLVVIIRAGATGGRGPCAVPGVLLLGRAAHLA